MKTLVKFIVAIAWTCFWLFAVIHNSTNDRFWVIFFPDVNVAQIQASPAWSWHHTSMLTITISGILLAVTWVAMLMVAKDWHVKFLGANGRGGQWIPFVPMALSIIFLLAGYSSKLVSNYVEIPKDRFDTMVQTGAIEKRGEHTYIDAKGDSLATIFLNKKNIIK